MLLYLHGFRSSPQSQKVRSLRAYMAERGLAHLLWCEQLPASPLQVIAMAESAIAASTTPVTLVGSSLGGYYATWLAEKHNLKAVLINPAVAAPVSLAEFIGLQTNLHTGEVFEFLPEHIEALRAMEVTRLSRPENFLLLVETGDEVLDYRDAVAKYAGCAQVVLKGGDHSFAHFDEYRGAILDFAGLRL